MVSIHRDPLEFLTVSHSCLPCRSLVNICVFSRLPLQERSNAFLFPRCGAGRCLGMQRSNKFILWQSRTPQSLLTEIDTQGWLDDIPTKHPPVLLQHEQLSAWAGWITNKGCSSLVTLWLAASIWNTYLDFVFLVAVVLCNWPHWAHPLLTAVLFAIQELVPPRKAAWDGNADACVVI